MDNTTPFVPHIPFTFKKDEFAAFTQKTVAMTTEIPDSPPITNAEIKKRARMGEKRLKEAEGELKIFQEFNSFLTPELAVPLMAEMLTCVRQSYQIEEDSTKLSAKMWTHGEVAGIDAMVMLSLAENLARLLAKLGNADAIRAVNALDNLKRNRGGGGSKSSGGDTPAEKKP